ncbi:hypothetical protein [Aneurinibacillus migulanus]|uniref:hypothetical protein n=1 Tax=Aneurinibacillus migulanus TaxID=47500 RepID=UPI000AFC18B3|nr:hypothetical protein [Aneurinibacillus migulanus]
MDTKDIDSSQSKKRTVCTSVWETNRCPFGERCDDDPFWMVLDNQYPSEYSSILSI